MPQIRGYPQVFSILPTDALVLDRIGVGTNFIEGVNVFPEAEGGIINANNIALFPGFWGLQSSLGVFTGVTLPALSSVVSPNYVEIGDMDNNSGVNTLTVNAFAGDLISDHGTTGATYTMSISNTAVRFIANRLLGYWAAMPFGT